MHLDFTDEQLELRDAARSALARECPPRLVAAVAAGGPGQDELTAALTWLGWPALAVDVDPGGLGRSFVELAVVLEELGRAAAPGPFLPTQTQFVPVVREAGTPAQVHRFLAGVAAGSLAGTLAIDEGGRWDPAAVVATAERDGDGWLLRGRKEHVLGAPDVDEVVVAARRDSGTLGLFVVPAAELTFKRTSSLDATRSLANVELNGIWVPDARMLGEPEVDAGAALTAALAEATVALALDALGVCDALLDSSLDVARRREGARASGQATEHLLADMLVAVETTRALVYQATAAVAERHPDAPRTASAAKAATSTCRRQVTAASLEIQGRAVDRDERDLRLWIGRATADDLLLGSGTDHRRIVADQMFTARRARPSPLAAALGR
jgi:alkylation response protein AidB-like acyl-CoA dehydrogenase